MNDTQCEICPARSRKVKRLEEVRTQHTILLSYMMNLGKTLHQSFFFEMLSISLPSSLSFKYFNLINYYFNLMFMFFSLPIAIIYPTLRCSFCGPSNNRHPDQEPYIDLLIAKQLIYNTESEEICSALKLEIYFLPPKFMQCKNPQGKIRNWVLAKLNHYLKLLELP